MDGPVYAHTGRASKFAERFLFWVFGGFFSGKCQFPAFKSFFSLILPVKFSDMKDCK